MLKTYTAFFTPTDPYHGKIADLFQQQYTDETKSEEKEPSCGRASL